MSETLTRKAAGDAPAPLTLDAVVIGAGVAGLYQLYLLRRQGLSVKAFDAAPDVGGTWYWNRYPGARFDSEGYIYQYLFSEDLYKGWSWSEKYPGQPEIERWMHYVADKLDLRRDLVLGTRIDEAVFDEATGRWRIRTDKGQVIDARYLVTCCGMLSAPMTAILPGQETFEGELFHTARWPEGVDLAGKRVGVIGTGSTGIQVIQTIAGEVEKLMVFVRTPQYSIPMKNPRYAPRDQEAYKARFDELRKTLPFTTSGFEYVVAHQWADLSPEERRKVLEDAWAEGSLRLWLASFAELYVDPEVNDAISDFVREKMRERLGNTRLAEILVPRAESRFGTSRVSLETGYLETFLKPNVEAIDVRGNPIERVVPEGVALRDGRVIALDVLILATGFDAGTGALSRIDIRGRGGRSLREDWRRDIRTTMGLQVHGYPNLFTTGAPLAPSAALCNMATCLQQQTEWIAGCIHYMRAHGFTTCEASAKAEEQWIAHHEELASRSLLSKANSWYTGANVAGKPRRLLSYVGGVGDYRQKCDEVARGGYAGFIMN